MTYKILAALCIILMVSCKKNDISKSTADTNPKMEYFDIHKSLNLTTRNEILIDLDKDKKPDVLFGILYVGDFILKQDKHRFIALTTIRTSLLVNPEEETPVLDENQYIPIENTQAYNWYGASEITLIEKITPMNNPSFWIGNWRNSTLKYLPIQLTKNNKRYNGWISISTNTNNEEIRIHRVALSTLPEVSIRAGK